ncbi:hypothetical protein HK096_001723, partial [Nowakowskiella sp. JEL0078]
MNVDDEGVVRFLKLFLPRFFWVDFSDVGPSTLAAGADVDNGKRSPRSVGTVSPEPEARRNGRGANLRRNVLTRKGAAAVGSSGSSSGSGNKMSRKGKLGEEVADDESMTSGVGESDGETRKWEDLEDGVET